jgi:hypothetical protein
MGFLMTIHAIGAPPAAGHDPRFPSTPVGTPPAHPPRYGAMNTALRRPDLYRQVVSIAGYFHTDDTSRIFDEDPTIEATNSLDQHVGAAAGLRVMLVDGQDDLEPVVEGEVQRFAALLRSAKQRDGGRSGAHANHWA